MQYIRNQNVLNRHPQNFQANTLGDHNNSTTPPSPPAPQPQQRFSFSSNYNASRFSAAATAVAAAASPSTNVAAKYNFSPTNAFAIFNRTKSPEYPNFGSPSSPQLIGGKPNAIVRPIRRSDNPLQAPAVAWWQPTTDASTGTADCQRTDAMPQPFPGESVMSERNFADELNRKLRFIRNKENQEVWSKSKNSSRNGSHREGGDTRPLFITTVPTGVFLPPAKDTPLAASLLRQRIYAYASHPVVYAYRGYNLPLASTAPPTYNHNNASTTTNTTTTTTTTNVRKALASAGGPGPTRTGGLVAGGLHLSKQQFQQQIQQHRSKREPQEPYKNIMVDKRVVRGSNFAGTRLVEDYDPLNKDDSRLRPNFRWKCRNQRNVLGTPPPVAGRRHEVIQTDKYLEELVRKPCETSIDTQTDLFLQLPPTPPYKPAKVGVDAATTIEDGDLFHFDAEAQPLIDVLVDSCIEQTMLEVSHEEELQKLRQKQDDFLAQREAELAELRRLEAEEKRISEERKRREHQEGVVKGLQREMAENVTAAKLLQGHIASLMPEILENIEPMTDTVGREKLMQTVCPWLSLEVAEEVGQIVDSREILTVIIQEIIKQRAETYMPAKASTPSLVEIVGSEGVAEEEHEATEMSYECGTGIELSEPTDVECPAPGTSAYGASFK